MTRLMVERLQCLADTPEWSADEVYLLVAVAATQGRAELRLFSVSARSWQGLSRGADRGTDVLVDADYQPGKLYLAALIEQDGRRDFDPAQVMQSAQRRVDEIYRSFASISGLSAAALAREICVALDTTIADLRDNDTELGSAFTVPVSLDAGGQVLLAGHDHRYRLWFKVSA